MNQELRNEEYAIYLDLITGQPTGQPTKTVYVAPDSPTSRCGRLAFSDTRNKENDMRERLAYLIMIGMLLVLITFVFAVVGKGEYQPPPPEKQENQGSVSHYGLL